MIPYFRRGILSIDFNEIEKQKDTPSNLEEQVVYQLQVMFSYLKETQKQYYNPRPFTSAFKDGNGNPMDVSVQMDVDEFFNILCERIEGYLKGTPQASLLKNMFNGKEAMQLIGNCGHRKENECDFNVITLTIKGKKSIIEALDSFVEGDLLDGDNAYFCDNCSKKVDTLKRTCLKTLPNVLILHLKRFDFDFDTMKNEKVNDYCEFPMSLDMFPYTREGIAKSEREKQTKSSEMSDTKEDEKEDDDDSDVPQKNESSDLPVFPREYYEYELKGILIHRGVADSGHYYSFIKERDGNGQWFEFNDEVVRPFNVENLTQECFGGQETVSQYNEKTKNYVRKNVPITRNAYMLIYERKQSMPVVVGNNVNGEGNESKHIPEIMDMTTQGTDKVPDCLYELVWKHNTRHQQEIWVFDKTYLETLYFLLRTWCEGNVESADKKSNDLFHFFGRVLLEIICHSQEKDLILYFTSHFISTFRTNDLACHSLLQLLVEDKKDGRDLLSHMLLQCHVEETREACAALLVRLFQIVFPQERDLFVECAQEDCFDEEANFTYPRKQDADAPITLRLLREMFVNFKFLPYHWRTFSEYFLTLREICLSDALVRAYLLSIELLPRLVDLFLGEDSPTAKKTTKKMGDKYTQPNFVHLLSLMGMLVCSCEIEGEKSPLALPAQANYPLPEEIIDIAVSPAFRKKILLQSSLEDVAKLFVHLSYNDNDISNAIMKWLSDEIHKAEHDGMRPYFVLLLPLLDVEDRLQTSRVSYILKCILKTVEMFKKYPMFTKTCIDYTESMRANPMVAKWMNDNFAIWDSAL